MSMLGGYRNRKLMRQGILSFSLPVIKSCPFAGECKTFCYVRKGSFRYKNVMGSYERNLIRTKGSYFVSDMIKEIKKSKAQFIRIHVSGDFYSIAYARKWIEIAKRVKGVDFYAYTKSFIFFKNLEIPDNLRIIQSFGGKNDSLIDRKRPHAVIFSSKKELLNAGFIDCSKNDLNVFCGNKIGLIKH